MKFKKDSLPVNAKDRIKYLYRFQEVLRLLHNKKGKDFIDGKITESEFRYFQNNWFKNRNQLICKEINKCRDKIPEFAEAKKLSLDDEYDVGTQYKSSKKDIKIQIKITDIEVE